ncbi:solute carrier family 49 member 4-like [Watersipora subatra]|uniref:solute carrier family 49 member 4-like n=1 Tax=Watersipora subatra TaxID=2589382 RepID=UPI00355BF9D2
MSRMNDSQKNDEQTPLLNSNNVTCNRSRLRSNSDTSVHEEHFHPLVYKRRWWILFVFCFCALAQSMLWNTFSPILDTMLIAYDWSDTFGTMLPAFSNGGYVIMAFPFMYIVETRDLRMGLIMAASLLVFGTSAWNIALPTGQDWLVVIGSLFNGLTACITMAAPPLLSVIWFPLSERTTATALSSMAGYMGTGMAFLTGPYITGTRVTANDVKTRANLTKEFVDDLRAGVQNVVYFDTAVAVMSITMILIYFPPKPPKPPSKSQTVEREDFWQGIKHLATNLQFWILNIAYNVPNGAFNSWIPLVSVNFLPLGVGETTAGWIGFASIMVGCFGSVGMSMIVDCFKRKIKLFMVFFNIVSVVIFAILVGIQLRFIPVPSSALVPLLYLLCMLAAFTINGVIPLYYEFGCEIAYPVHEGLSCSFITVINNLVGMSFFLLFQIHELAVDTEWMSCTCLGTCLLSFPLIFILKERFYRLDLEYSSDSHQGSINDGDTSSSTISA